MHRLTTSPPATADGSHFNYLFRGNLPVTNHTYAAAELKQTLQAVAKRQGASGSRRWRRGKGKEEGARKWRDWIAEPKQPRPQPPSHAPRLGLTAAPPGALALPPRHRPATGLTLPASYYLIDLR